MEISADEMDAQMPHFEATGELPGMPGVTIEDLAARGWQDGAD